MNKIMPFVQKDNSYLPDFYTITVHSITGKQESFEIASHKFVQPFRLFEFVTTDDLWNAIPLDGISRISFDKNYSKIVQLSKEKENGNKNESHPV